MERQKKTSETKERMCLEESSSGQRSHRRVGAIVYQVSLPEEGLFDHSLEGTTEQTVGQLGSREGKALG